MGLLWCGPRESDILNQEAFSGSLTIFGTNSNKNIAYTKKQNVRINHNKLDSGLDAFYTEELDKWTTKDPDIKILYYNSLHSKHLPDKYKNHIVGANDISLLEFLDSKSEVRKLASRNIPIVPFQCVDNISQLINSLSDLDKGCRYILQENHSSGGYGTHIINKDNVSLHLNAFDNNKGYFISPYFDNSIPINVHCILFDEEIVVCPGSIQLVKELENKIIFLGSDFIEYQSLSDKIKEKIINNSKVFCETLRNMGYRGVLGIDFLIIDNEPLFLEVNGRFQASTVVLNRALKKEKLPSMQEIHLLAFQYPTFPFVKEVEMLDVFYSMVAFTSDTWEKDLNPLDLLGCQNVVSVDRDGYEQSENKQSGSYLFRIVFDTNLCSINADGDLWIYENIFDIKDDFFEAIINHSKLHIKISLLNQGVIITQQAKQSINKTGKIREAVFSAVDITIMDNLHVNTPVDVKFIYLTPWRIDVDSQNQLKLYYYNNEISNVTLDVEDPYRNNKTKSGLLFRKISFWATDRMRINHTISCIFKKNDIGCCFCEIPKQEETLCLKDVFEVIDFYLTHNPSFRHFLIGGGSEAYIDEANNITKIVTYIRSKSDKPIYLMCLPPKKTSVLKTWYEAGVTEIAFNLEFYDRDRARLFMPGKGLIPIEQYFSAFDEAVSLWGNNGKVRSILIVGLEKEESLLKGITELCSRGVMPILSVFRALHYTETEHVVPPPNSWLHNIYITGESISTRYKLHLGPDCPACQNNTLSLPF